jgi:hypothetical protein
VKKRKRHPHPYLPALPHRDRVRGQRGTQIYLPPLDPEQAWSVVIVLEHIIHTIWRTHGDAMADYQGRVWPDLPPPPDAQVYRSITPTDDDQDF